MSLKQPKKPQASEALLDLAQPRFVVLTDRNREYVLHCRRVTADDWAAYFAGIVVTGQQMGAERVNVVDTVTPRVTLAEAVLESAEGYKVEGGADLNTLPDWTKLIPLAHRQMLGVVLADARPSPASDELVIRAEGEVVLLDATWSAVFSSQGLTKTYSMQCLHGLKHVLASPSEEQYRRYNGESNRTLIVGGRSGKTIYPGANALLAKLYDELILSVDGYTFSGVPLSGRATIISHMDTLHKVMAAQELFNPTSTVQLAGGE